MRHERVEQFLPAFLVAFALVFDQLFFRSIGCQGISVDQLIGCNQRELEDPVIDNARQTVAFVAVDKVLSLAIESSLPYRGHAVGTVRVCAAERRSTRTTHGGPF